MKRKPVEIIFEMLGILKELGKLKEDAEPFDKKTLARKTAELSEDTTYEEKLQKHLAIVNEYISVRISAFVSDVMPERSDFNSADDKMNLIYVHLRMQLKQLYQELKTILK